MGPKSLKMRWFLTTLETEKPRSCRSYRYGAAPETGNAGKEVIAGRHFSWSIEADRF